ncbi:MAG: AAA family ATPase, partial [Chloroflexi bacterium]
LEHLHGSGNHDSMVYWLEFKNDDEFPAIFGSIAGGSAHKFGIFRSAKTGEWTARDETNYPRTITTAEAIAVARRHRDQLIRGAELLEQLPPDATDEDYRILQAGMDSEAPDVSRLAWGHKYFSLLYPDRLDDYHAESYQRFHLIKLLQLPPEGEGRYLCAGRYVAIARELGMPLNHLTTVLNEIHGRPYQYWRIATSTGEYQEDYWPLMRDENCVAIGWPLVGDLSARFSSGKELAEALRSLLVETYYPGRTLAGVATQKANEIKRFVNLSHNPNYLTAGNRVLAANGQTVLGIGRVTGEYQFEEESELPHRRPVRWLSRDEWTLPEPEGLRTTVYELRRHPVNLLETERRVLDAKSAPVSTAPRSVVPRAVRLDGIPGRIQSILERKGQVILYGPPGTGKTYWAEITARDLAAYSVFGRSFAELPADQQGAILGYYVQLCSFHPGYGYEDFLEGYRPEVVNDQMTFVPRDGIFKQICDAALAEPSHNFYLIIDEINRGDVPRIFGELLTVLEKDKRGKAILLPLSERPFRVPRNVYLIGTMNTADRSIALLDTALRRRFGFLELMPDYDVLAGATVAGIPLAPWLEALNRRILEHVGRDARNLQIGHAYLLEGGRPITSFARFARVIEEDIIPLLEEYCYEDYSALEKILGPGLVDARTRQIRHELFDPAHQDDFIQALLAPSPEITTSIQAARAEESDAEEDDDQLYAAEGS